MRRLAVVYLFFFVTACATDKFDGVSRSYEFTPDTKKGIVFFSTSFKSEPSTLDCGSPKAGIRLARAEGINSWNIRLYYSRSEPFFEEPFFGDPHGYFVARALSEGEYVFTDLHYGYFEAKEPVGIRFRVTAGEIHYLGQINVTTELGCLSYDITVKDRRDRDVLIFAREMENFGPDSVKYQILKP